MKSKNVRRVILRTPRMKRVRNNLRVILKLAIKDELHQLSKINDIYHDKLIKSHLTPSQRIRRDYIGGKYRNLYHRFIDSTLQCSGGSACYSFKDAKKGGFSPRDRPTDFDIVWVPWLEKWFCLKCFVLNRLGEMTHEDFDDPVAREWVKEEFGI